MSTVEPMSDSQWMTRVLKTPPLSRADLDQLLRDYARAVASTSLGHEGKRATKLRQRIVECNLRLVASVASRIKAPRDWSQGDMLALGAIGLDRAVRKFDASTGYALSTYAPWWIRHEITRGIQDTASTVRLPVHAQETARKPAQGERAARLQELVQAARGIASLDATVGRPDDATRTTLGDVTADDSIEHADDVMAREADTVWVRACVAELPERERDVIEMRMEGLALKDVGEQLGLSRERVRQLEMHALASIRARMMA